MTTVFGFVRESFSKVCVLLLSVSFVVWDLICVLFDMVSKMVGWFRSMRIGVLTCALGGLVDFVKSCLVLKQRIRFW